MVRFTTTSIGVEIPRVILSSNRERDAGQLGADRDEAILKRGVVRLRVRGEQTLVVEVLAGHLGLRFIAGGKPDLGEMRLVHVVWRTGSPHLGRNPARLE